MSDRDTTVPPPVDIDALRKALDAWPNELGDDDAAEEVATFLAFRAAQILLESAEAWYCKAHGQTNWNDQGCWVFDMGPGECDMTPCRIVQVSLPKVGFGG